MRYRLCRSVANPCPALCQPRTSVWGPGFQTRENASSRNDGAFSPGENAQFRDLNHSWTSHRCHVLYQGTASAVPSNMGLMRPLGPELRFFPKGTGFSLYLGD